MHINQNRHMLLTQLHANVMPQRITGTFEQKVRQLENIRNARSCAAESIAAESALVGADGELEVVEGLLDTYLPFPLFVQIAILFAAAVVLLMFIGFLKGLIGVTMHAPTGMLGLGYLIDMPQPLSKYQESELVAMKVIYDEVGWPIHPQTGKRTVRALTKKTEFCLNLVFFLAFPILLIISAFSGCCVHKTYDEEDDACFYKVNTIMLSDTPSLKALAHGCTKKTLGEKKKGCKTAKFPCPNIHSNAENTVSKPAGHTVHTIHNQNSSSKNSRSPNTYRDEDTAEEEDTKYVLEQLKNSQETLSKSSK